MVLLRKMSGALAGSDGHLVPSFGAVEGPDKLSIGFCTHVRVRIIAFWQWHDLVCRKGALMPKEGSLTSSAPPSLLWALSSTNSVPTGAGNTIHRAYLTAGYRVVVLRTLLRISLNNNDMATGICPDKIRSI